MRSFTDFLIEKFINPVKAAKDNTLIFVDDRVKNRVLPILKKIMGARNPNMEHNFYYHLGLQFAGARGNVLSKTEAKYFSVEIGEDGRLLVALMKDPKSGVPTVVHVSDIRDHNLINQNFGIDKKRVRIMSHNLELDYKEGSKSKLDVARKRVHQKREMEVTDRLRKTRLAMDQKREKEREMLMRQDIGNAITDF